MGVGICVVNNPHDLQWSPFEENLLAVSCRNRPGHTPISGVLYTLEFMPVNDIEIRDQVQLNVGLDLLAWSERDPGTVAASCEDGTLRFFDLHNETNVMAAQWFLGGYATDDGRHGTSSSSTAAAARSLQWDRISLEMVLTANAGHHSVDVHSVDTTATSSNVDLGEQGDLEPHVLLHCDAHEAVVMDARWDTSSPFCFMCTLPMLILGSLVLVAMSDSHHNTYATLMATLSFITCVCVCVHACMCGHFTIIIIRYTIASVRPGRIRVPVGHETAQQPP